MSMSQEEIEALMNGIEIGDDDSSEEVEVNTEQVNTEQIEELLSQSTKEEQSSDVIDELNDVSSSEKVSSEDIDELLKDIESSNFVDEKLISSNEVKNESVAQEVEEVSDIKVQEEVKNQTNEANEDLVESWTSNKIDAGVFPLPAEKDTKVVSQLSQVANDSEEKVSQIFDVLSMTLDNNNLLRNYLKDTEDFINEQATLLKLLGDKFPNVEIFNQYEISSSKVLEKLDNIKNDLNSEDNAIFQAMELMQFNDINRQKIERVMAVIRKLSLYLNNLFEDDQSSKEVVVAKHIHGDSNNDLIGDDLDKLIEEFAKDKE